MGRKKERERKRKEEKAFMTSFVEVAQAAQRSFLVIS